MKKLLLFLLPLLIFLLASFLLSWQSLFFKKINLPFATLQIKTWPKSQTVFLDGQELGVTPLLRQNLLAGEHLLRVSNWEKRITLTSGSKGILELKLSPKGAIIAGYQIFYQKLPLFGGKHNLSIFVNESKVLISIKNEQGEIKHQSDEGGLISLGPGRYQVTIEKVAFLTQEFSIEVIPKFLAVVEVELAPDLFFGIKEADQVLDIQKNETLQEKIEAIPSLTWRENPLTYTKSQLKFFNWQRLSFFNLPQDPQKWDFSKQRQVFDLLQSLEFQSQTQFNNLGLPFCYIISERGQIFEGLGIYDFDFSQMQMPAGAATFEKGDCPVGFLVNKDKEALDLAKRAVTRLANFLAEKPFVSVRLLSEVSQLELMPGEEREVLLEFQNVSSLVWQKKEGEKVFLTTYPRGRVSEIYHPTWISSGEVSLFVGEQIYPNEVAKFSFKIRAPFYPIDLKEEVALFDEQGKVVIENSGVTLKINVKKEGSVVIEVIKTPTGFLNIRKTPSVNASLAGTAYEGERYLVLEKLMDWYKVLMHDGSEGFVSARYTKEVH